MEHSNKTNRSDDTNIGNNKVLCCKHSAGLAGRVAVRTREDATSELSVRLSRVSIQNFCFGGSPRPASLFGIPFQLEALGGGSTEDGERRESRQQRNGFQHPRPSTLIHKQTPWPLVRKKTIPTERPPLVGEI
jgi:hypothetical protein